MSWLKATGTVFIYIGLFLAVITFLPGLPPDTEFQEYSIVPPRDLNPRPKNRLTGAQKLFEGKIIGAEGFHSYNGQLYSGIHSGYIIRVEEDRIVPIVKFGKKCESFWQEDICGRPLGLKFDKKGNLFVMDSYYGIFKVNVETGEYINIVNSSEPINGKIPMLPNSIDIAKNGDFYWTDSSTVFHLNTIMPLFFINPSGRFMRYNTAKKTNEVLMENLGFANGVKLSDDESFVLVAESLSCRIMKYHLKGPKAGQQEIFIEGLPGMPDNLQSDNHGGFLVTTVLSIDSEHPQLTVSLIPHPYLRKMIVRVLLLLSAPFKLLNDFIPNMYAERFAHAIVAYEGIGMLFNQNQKSIVLRIDASGNIMEALSSDDDTISGISDAYIHNGYLWFGSPWRHYIARVPLKQAFPDLANNEKLTSHKNEKQSANAADVNSGRMKRDTDSVTTKPIESKPKQASSQTPKPTAAHTTTPKPTATPTTTPKPTAAPTTTSKPTTAPTATPKPAAVPKPSPAPKASKPISSGNAKSSETKPVSKSVNAEIKDNAKSNSPNAKTESSSKTEKDSMKTNTAKSEKNVKVEQDTPIKQKMPKSESEKVKSAETNNHPKDSKKN